MKIVKLQEMSNLVGSLTESGKRIVFHRVTKKIERVSMNCTRHDEMVRDSMNLYET